MGFGSYLRKRGGLMHTNDFAPMNDYVRHVDIRDEIVMQKPEKSALSGELMQLYGPLMSGPTLYRSLGFNSYLAFHRALGAGTLGVKVFAIKGRRGRFALTIDVAGWLEVQRLDSSSAQ